MGNILLPKGYHPDFRVPTRKPISRVCLDINSDAVKNPHACFLLGDREDKYNNRQINYLNANINQYGVYGVGSNAEVDFQNTKFMDLDNEGRVWFFHVVFKVNSISNYSNYCALKIGGAQILFRNSTSSIPRVNFTGGINGTFDANNSVYTLGSRVCFTGQVSENEDFYYYVKNITTGRRAYFESTYRGTSYYSAVNEHLVTAYDNTCYVELTYSGLGYVDKNSAEYINNNPYSILKPANDQYYFVPDGGGVGGDNYSGTATSTNAATSTASGQKTSTGTATSTLSDTTTTASFKTGLGNVTSINTASTVKTGLAIMLGTAISLNVAATTTAGTKSETATGTATSSNAATVTTTGDKLGLGTATSNNTSTTTTDGVQSGTGAGSATSTNTASTATAGSKSGLGLVSSVNGYLITLQSNAIMLGTAASSNTSESTVIGLSENDASGTLTSTSTSQTITAGNKIGLGDVDSANTSATTTTATTDRDGTITSANTSSAIVSGANTAAPVIIRSVDLVCELPYILLTRAIDGSLFMAYPPEVSNITTAYQNNDTNINVVITDNGDAVSMGSITEAEYVIASRDKSQTYVSKSLGSGISKGTEQLVLSLSQADTSALLDIYYHELQITSDGKHATVFAEHINFIDTVI